MPNINALSHKTKHNCRFKHK